jgi:hypothetical protein
VTPRRIVGTFADIAYPPDRKGEHAAQHLKKFRGTLQADACAGVRHEADSTIVQHGFAMT